MKSLTSATLFLSVAVHGADLEFKNVSHLETAVIAFGVATTNGNDMYVPASDGGSVGVIESHDGGATTEYTLAETAALPMTAGASPSTVAVGGLFGVGISTDFGNNFTQVMPDIGKAVVTQDIKYEAASGLFGVAGTVNGAGAVAVSGDEGKTWAAHPVVTTPPLINPSSIRYASYPTKDTWYATAGFWGDDDVVETGGVRRLTKHIVAGPKGVEVASKQAMPSPLSSTYSGAWGSVVKTTDGGATWDTVFNDTSSGLYPNDIHCSDADTCAFALDITDPSQGGQIVTTTDGGVTWARNTLPAGSSLMGVRFASPGTTDVWVSGGDTTGKLWHSTDLVNWDTYATAVTDASYLFSFALTPDGTSSYATGVLRSQLCSILKIDF